jgi:hypothetical protein
VHAVISMQHYLRTESDKTKMWFDNRRALAFTNKKHNNTMTTLSVGHNDVSHAYTLPHPEKNLALNNPTTTCNSVRTMPNWVLGDSKKPTEIAKAI